MYELEVTKYFDVADAITNKVLMTFTYEETAHYTGEWSDHDSYGVMNVEISPDGHEVLFYDSGNKEPRRIPLPVSEEQA